MGDLGKYILPKALKSGPKSYKSPNLVTLSVRQWEEIGWEREWQREFEIKENKKVWERKKGNKLLERRIGWEIESLKLYQNQCDQIGQFIGLWAESVCVLEREIKRGRKCLRERV